MADSNLPPGTAHFPLKTLSQASKALAVFEQQKKSEVAQKGQTPAGLPPRVGFSPAPRVQRFLRNSLSIKETSSGRYGTPGPGQFEKIPERPDAEEGADQVSFPSGFEAHIPDTSQGRTLLDFNPYNCSLAARLAPAILLYATPCKLLRFLFSASAAHLYSIASKEWSLAYIRGVVPSAASHHLACVLRRRHMLPHLNQSGLDLQLQGRVRYASVLGATPRRQLLLLYVRH